VRISIGFFWIVTPCGIVSGYDVSEEGIAPQPQDESLLSPLEDKNKPGHISE
jgi:hypothetical protein